jgi:hypothetical protein
MRWAMGLVAAGALAGCPGSQALPKGPPPEYEKPVLSAWDAGRPSPASDPFAAAQEGAWVDETGGAGNADAGNQRDARAQPDARADGDAAPDAGPAAIGH